MATLNDLQWQAWSTNLGHGGQLNDLFVEYFQGLTGSSSYDPQDLWYAQLTLLGYTGAVQDMQFAYWGDLGYTGSWNDRYYAWLVDTGGTFGPNVQVVFHADTFNPTTKQLVMELVGLGAPPTHTHTATMYALDQDANWRPFAAGKPLWWGGRYVDDDNVFADVTPGGALIDPQPYRQFYPAQTNILHNSNVVGTETPTVTTGKVSIVVFVDSGDSASAIVTAGTGTATATGYGTATPGSPIELDVTGAGTISVELTGTPFAVNVTEVEIARAVLNGPIITAAAPVATDITVYNFDPVNQNVLKSAWYLELFGADQEEFFNRQMIAIGVATNAFPNQQNNTTILANRGDNFMNTDYINTSDANTSIASDSTLNFGVSNKLAVNYYDTSADIGINLNGVWEEDTNFKTMLASFTQLASGRSNNGNYQRPMRVREIKRFDTTSYADGKSIIDGENA